MPNLLKFFPVSDKSPSPRESQVEILNHIERVFKSGKKFVIGRLPTGTGKSHVAVTLARSSRQPSSEIKELLDTYRAFAQLPGGEYAHEDTFNNSSFFGGAILTVSKSLQDQYLKDFDDIKIYKGKSNYQCEVDPNVSADIAPCLTSKDLKKECFAEDRCPYYRARKISLISLDPVLNYRVFFSMPGFLQRRQHLILDEADQLDAELLGHYSLSLNYAQLSADDIPYRKVLTDDSEEMLGWVNDLQSAVKDKVDDIKSKLDLVLAKGNTKDGIALKNKQKLSRLRVLLGTLDIVCANWVEAEYMVEARDAKGVVLVPFNTVPLAARLFERADKVLLMSATIPDPEAFAKELGIKPKDYEFIDIGSVFDAEKSPIFCSNKYSLSYKTMNTALPRILEMAASLCEKHKGEKGIIHTHSMQITEEVQKKLGRNTRFLFREAGVRNEDIVLEHKTRKDDTILVSPSLDTGVSLDDDLGRFQIIIKAPYAPLSSKRIKRKFDKNPDQYVVKMLGKLIQMCGRSTRSAKDHSVTYILDGNAVSAVLKYKKNLPKYFLDRFA